MIPRYFWFLKSSFNRSLLNRVLGVLACLRALHVYVLACSRARHVCVFACWRAWRVCVLMCWRAWRAWMLTCWHVCVLACLAFLHAGILAFLRAWRVCVLAYFYARALLTCFLWCVLGLLTFLPNYLFCMHKSRLCNQKKAVDTCKFELTGVIIKTEIAAKKQQISWKSF